ncbi:MAG: T9SS type A sorting domain-containing protein [candidate division WOR-3 bacterium]|nr:T9SS type A sorting domain-containing protein [candidate division WOR-3 bacterium]
MSIDSTKENTYDPYTIVVSPNCPNKHKVQFQLIVSEGSFVDTFRFSLIVGQRDYLIWNPALSNSGIQINTILTSLGYIGDYTTSLLTIPQLDAYQTIFVCCGIFPYDYIIGAMSPEGFALENYLQNGGKMYLEGSNVWCENPYRGGYNFNSLFGIWGAEVGTNNLGPVIGQTGTFTQGMYFNYAGPNNAIDHLEPTTGFTILKDQNDFYGCGIANNAVIYRTVGTSFELGGLVDASAPSTKAILLDSIMRFFNITYTGTEENNPISTTQYQLKTYPNIIKSGELIKIYYSPLNNQHAEIKVYNSLGQCVRDIAVEPNTANVLWNGTDNNNQYLPSGIYFIHLDLKEKTLVNRIVIID